MFEFSMKPLIILMVAIAAIALFWWPGFITEDKRVWKERIGGAVEIVSPANEVDAKGKWVKGKPKAYPFKTKLTNGDNTALKVEILGRSESSVRFTKSGNEQIFDYPIIRLSPESQQAILGLPVTIATGAPAQSKDRISAGIEDDIKRTEATLAGLSEDLRNAENASVRGTTQKEISRRQAELQKLQRRLQERKASLK